MVSMAVRSMQLQWSHPLGSGQNAAFQVFVLSEPVVESVKWTLPGCLERTNGKWIRFFVLDVGVRAGGWQATVTGVPSGNAGASSKTTFPLCMRPRMSIR